MIISVLTVYVLCTFIDILRQKFIEKPIFSLIDSKWGFWKK